MESQGLSPSEVGAAMCGEEVEIDALSLRILERLAAREKLPRGGPGYLEKRRTAITDAMVAHLISLMLEAIERRRVGFAIPPSFVMLVKHHVCGLRSDLEVQNHTRDRQRTIAVDFGMSLKAGESPSINKLAIRQKLPRTTAARWLADEVFKHWLDLGRSAREMGYGQ